MQNIQVSVLFCRYCVLLYTIHMCACLRHGGHCSHLVSGVWGLFPFAVVNRFAQGKYEKPSVCLSVWLTWLGAVCLYVRSAPTLQPSRTFVAILHILRLASSSPPPPPLPSRHHHHIQFHFSVYGNSSLFKLSPSWVSSIANHTYQYP